VSATVDPVADEGDFAVGRCAFCERDVLTYPDGDPSAPGARRCIHCDDRVRGSLRWIDAADLEALGYGVDSGEDPAGCETCANGSCARGR
jgi:hypothetical protein